MIMMTWTQMNKHLLRILVGIQKVMRILIIMIIILFIRCMNKWILNYKKNHHKIVGNNYNKKRKVKMITNWSLMITIITFINSIKIILSQMIDISNLKKWWSQKQHNYSLHNF